MKKEVGFWQMRRVICKEVLYLYTPRKKAVQHFAEGEERDYFFLPLNPSPRQTFEMPRQPRMTSSVENGLPAFPSQSGAAHGRDASAPLPDQGSPPGAGAPVAAGTSDGPGFTRQSSCGPGSQGPPGDADAWRASKPQLRYHGGPLQRAHSVPTVSAAIDRPGTGITKEEGRTGGEQVCCRTCGILVLAVVMVLFSPIIAVGVCMHDLIVCGSDDHELYK
ncbi:hypothetical protein SKAU_G00265790 [Synaphobranchus kaupii]|uniref:Uncharacterized protein n=1 Tax=Synaphobranchus kaupii TaxID=118154 RepID=A0A9Q1EZH8_SYNKA|nr:hypothetical protein SKAU_G00265790 [Synaphobranchus kaupii]